MVAGEQKLHVVDIGIKLDDLESDLAGEAGLDDGGGERVDERLHLGLDAAGAELVGVIDDQADDGRVLRVDAAGVLSGDDDGGIDFAGAHVFAGLHLVGVLDGGEGLDVDGDGVEGFAELDGLRAVVVVDNRDAAPTILPPKALPMMTNCRIGIISDMIMRVGERKNLRISRSTMANILFMAALPAGAAW